MVKTRIQTFMAVVGRHRRTLSEEFGLKCASAHSDWLDRRDAQTPLASLLKGCPLLDEEHTSPVSDDHSASLVERLLLLLKLLHSLIFELSDLQ